MNKRYEGRSAAVYARAQVSVKADDAGSVESQVEKCLWDARSEGLVVADEHVCVDRGSGMDPNRVGLAKMKALIESGAVEVVSVCGVDRLTRDLAELVGLLRLMRDARVVLMDANRLVEQDWIASVEELETVVRLLGMER